jgi:hypothetical protein
MYGKPVRQMISKPAGLLNNGRLLKGQLQPRVTPKNVAVGTIVIDRAEKASPN